MTGKKAGDNTFIKITNKDIYEMLMNQQTVLNELLVQAKFTNGKVKLNRKMVYGLGTLMFTVTLFILNILYGVV